MIDVSELQDEVDAAFALIGRDTPPWPDPFPDRSVPEDAYSRLTHPAKWRIVGARADAWVTALVRSGRARIEPRAAVRWRAAPGLAVARVDRVIPMNAGALELVIGRMRVGDIDDAGVVLGLGDPTACVDWFPDCGCDACDSGSQAELDHLDTHLRSIVTGSFRRLTAGRQVITVLDEDSWSASNVQGPVRRRVAEALARPAGWDELRGRSWLDDDR